MDNPIRSYHHDRNKLIWGHKSRHYKLSFQNNIFHSFKKAMSCQISSEMTLIRLNDKMLLHLFKFLNWIDSINLAMTCTRLKNVKFWVDKQNQEFDLNEYIEKVSVPIEIMLPVIAPYIRVAKISEHVICESFMQKCCNIKSLKIDECISHSAATTYNVWMKRLNIESLSIDDGFLDVDQLLDGICGLKELVFDSHQKLPSDFFNKSSAIQHLLLILQDDYDLSSLQVLHSLQSLFLCTKTSSKNSILDDVKKWIKIDNTSRNFLYVA